MDNFYTIFLDNSPKERAIISQVVTALGKSKACKISNILLLELEKDMEERKEALLFSLYFLLETRVRVTSSASGISTAISILGKNVGTESGPQIVFITSI